MAKLLIEKLDEYEEIQTQTFHGIQRTKERVGFKGKAANRFLVNAFQRGIREDACKNQSKRLFLKSKQDRGAIAVAYNGFCVIFNQDGKCITIYQMPKYLETV